MQGRSEVYYFIETQSFKLQHKYMFYVNDTELEEPDCNRSQSDQLANNLVIFGTCISGL